MGIDCTLNGQELGVETPFIDEIMEGASSTRGKQILKGEKISLEQCLSGTCAMGFPPTCDFGAIMDVKDF